MLPIAKKLYFKIKCSGVILNSSSTTWRVVASVLPRLRITLPGWIDNKSQPNEAYRRFIRTFTVNHSCSLDETSPVWEWGPANSTSVCRSLSFTALNCTALTAIDLYCRSWILSNNLLHWKHLNILGLQWPNTGRIYWFKQTITDVFQSALVGQLPRKLNYIFHRFSIQVE